MNIKEPNLGESIINRIRKLNPFQVYRKGVKKMNIKEPNPGESIINRIRELIPLLDLEEISPEQISFSIANRVYFIGLDSLLKKRPIPELVCLRVYGFKNATPVAFFDVVENKKDVVEEERPSNQSAEEEEEPSVLQMAISKKYLDAYMKARKKAIVTVEQSANDFELRLLRVPALNFEAVWIHSKGKSKNVLVPLRAVGQLIAFNAVPFDDALEALREAARPLAHMDETMGA